MKHALLILSFAIALTLFSFVLAALMHQSLFNLSTETQHWIQFIWPIILSLAITIRLFKNKKDPEKRAMYQI